MQLARRGSEGRPPVMLAVAGDSGAGKATLARGLVDALGPERVAVVAVDDYQRHDRREREALPFTALNPASSFIEIMAQHVELLALGEPILKPTYECGVAVEVGEEAVMAPVRPYASLGAVAQAGAAPIRRRCL